MFLLTYDAKCDSLSCQLPPPLPRVKGVRQPPNSPQTPNEHYRLHCLIPLFLRTLPSSGYWLFAAFSHRQKPFHTDRLSHCSACTTHSFQLRTHINCPARVFEHFLSRKLNLRALKFEWRCKLRERVLLGECASHMIITSCVRYILTFRS